MLHDGDSYACRLVDTPFEDVPQGGPHLTADASRAHGDLPFVWHVVDTVLAQDRRARWMLHWLFGTAAIQTPQVLDGEEPVLLVVNDEDEEHPMWQLIGSTDAGEDGRIAHLFHAVDRDETLLDVLDLPPGWEADRERVGGPWTRVPRRPDPGDER